MTEFLPLHMEVHVLQKILEKKLRFPYFFHVSTLLFFQYFYKSQISKNLKLEFGYSNLTFQQNLVVRSVTMPKVTQKQNNMCSYCFPETFGWCSVEISTGNDHFQRKHQT